MARIRTIKPDFFTSDTVSALPLRARLTWIGLWTHCDDWGRCRDNVKLIKAAVWPLDDVALRDIAEDLDLLADAGVIRKYAVDGRDYLQITAWSEHQKVDRPSKSAIPAPQAVDNHRPPRSGGAREPSMQTREPSTSPRAGKGKEGKGREGNARAGERETPRQRAQRPPDRCDDHIDNPDPPDCGRCAGARKAAERWDRDQAAAELAADAARRSEQAHARAAAARAAIDACSACDPDGRLPGGVLCHHDPGTPNRARRGAATARAALRQLSEQP